ncbi:hypothetical protein GCM10009682_01910 [Luedemannella flava]|uniref:LppX_LprAFG lipoprotein n=2 Tax=Luedemannella flava TaxID=349316 RepID=A0ABN2LCL3_9ACTN
MAAAIGLAALAGCTPAPTPTPPTQAEPTLGRTVVDTVKSHRTATVTLAMESRNREGNRLTGTVEFTATGVNADLSGTIDATYQGTQAPARIRLVDGTMYVADYFTLPAGRTWVAIPLHQKLPDAGQWRWALLDQIAGFLGYIADERLMRELTYNPGSTTAPDGVPVRGARAKGSVEDLLATMSQAQQARLRDSVMGVQFVAYLDEGSLPHRLVASWINGPAADIAFTEWSRPQPVRAPPADEVHSGGTVA